MSPFPQTHYLPNHNAAKFVKKLIGEKDVEAVLQRLDRLTPDEARTTLAQTLEVLYCLVKNISVVDGDIFTLTFAGCRPFFGLDDKAYTGIRDALGMFRRRQRASSIFD